jgi:Protein of unknown function (DUF3551)
MRRILSALALCALGFTASNPRAPRSPIRGVPSTAAEMAAGANCGFWTYQQCVATISGNGGYCETNAMYRGPQPGMIPPPPGLPRLYGY